MIARLPRSPAAAARVAAAALLLALLVPAGARAGNDPKLPPGRDPEGVPVAIIGPGIDYRIPEVAGRIARDGEGELIGWDFVENDDRPFETPSSCAGAGSCTFAAYRDTAVAGQLVSEAAGVRLIALRVADGDRQGQAAATLFAARSPARIVAVLVANGSRTGPDWQLAVEAARRFSNLLFVVPFYGGATSAPPEVAGLVGNLVTAAPVPSSGEPLTGSGRGEPIADLAIPLTDIERDALGDNRAQAERAAIRVAALAASISAAEPFHDAHSMKQRLLSMAAGGTDAAAGRTRGGVIKDPAGQPR